MKYRSIVLGHEKLKVESAHAGCMIVTPPKIIFFDQAYTPKTCYIHPRKPL